jgi:hypothetical protein
MQAYCRHNLWSSRPVHCKFGDVQVAGQEHCNAGACTQGGCRPLLGGSVADPQASRHPTSMPPTGQMWQQPLRSDPAMACIQATITGTPSLALVSLQPTTPHGPARPGEAAHFSHPTTCLSPSDLPSLALVSFRSITTSVACGARCACSRCGLSARWETLWVGAREGGSPRGVDGQLCMHAGQGQHLGRMGGLPGTQGQQASNGVRACHRSGRQSDAGAGAWGGSKQPGMPGPKPGSGAQPHRAR